MSRPESKWAAPTVASSWSSAINDDSPRYFYEVSPEYRLGQGDRILIGHSPENHHMNAPARALHPAKHINDLTLSIAFCQTLTRLIGGSQHNSTKSDLPCIPSVSKHAAR